MKMNVAEEKGPALSRGEKKERRKRLVMKTVWNLVVSLQ